MCNYKIRIRPTIFYGPAYLGSVFAFTGAMKAEFAFVRAGRTLILQDWYAENSLLNPSLYALMELYPLADLGFLRNFESTIPTRLRDRQISIYGTRMPRKALDDLESLIEIEAQIPWADYELVIANTAGYLRHLRREKISDTRYVVYQHDLLASLWRADTEHQNTQEAAALMRAQEIDLEFSGGINLTIAANYALRNSLASMLKAEIPLAYPLIDQNIFFPDTEAEAEYFVALDAAHLDKLIHLVSCISDKLVVFGNPKPDKLLRELKPENIFYTGPLSPTDQAYYLAGAKALICGEATELSHLPLAALKCGTPLIAHPTQGMSELLSDPDAGIELTTASTDEILAAIRHYRKAKPMREKIAASLDWLNQEYFLRRMRKALAKNV